MHLAESSRAELHAIARNAIRFGLTHNSPPALNLDTLPPDIRELGATFATLRIAGALRGCIGSIEAVRPLAEDVNKNAHAAAFRDSRFAPLSADEEPRVDIHLSLLAPAVELPCSSETDLLNKLRPGVDGLLLEDGHYRAIFLPAVWEDLPNPRDFLRNLKRKAGLPASYWSDTLRFKRCEVETI
ncbi:MAG: AmmeMemoRadiSam system protein A [Kiritimatiellae bacterium]|nr:AmmeMemoRadiSam system protein A [Kiritimatiellia bacterium]